MSQQYWTQLEESYREMPVEALGREIGRLGYQVQEAVEYAKGADRLDAEFVERLVAEFDLAQRVLQEREGDPEEHPLYEVVYRFVDCVEDEIKGHAKDAPTYTFREIIHWAKGQKEAKGLSEDEVEIICHLALECVEQNIQFMAAVDEWGELIACMLKEGKSEIHIMNRVIRESHRMVSTGLARELLAYVEGDMMAAAMPDYPAGC